MAEIRLLPVEVKEAQTESGFDDFPRFDSTNTPPHPWVMIPEGGVDKNRFVLTGLGDFELSSQWNRSRSATHA